MISHEAAPTAHTAEHCAVARVGGDVHTAALALGKRHSVGGIVRSAHHRPNTACLSLLGSDTDSGNRRR